MVPIFIQGEKEVPNSYRPVSLTLVPGKVMEQIIKQVVHKHLMDNAVLNKSQHGFFRNKSCQTNLLFFARLTSLVDAGNVVDFVYLDVSQAFDKVPHDILVNKSVKTELDKVTIKWICNWLAGRT